MKYTFEIMKEYEDAIKGISVYSVSEDKKLMVDFVAMEELEDAQKEIDEAYQRGLDDIWECMKKIAFLEKPRDMRDFFGCSTLGGVLIDYSASEAIEKLKAYEEEQKADDEIKVGDEVEVMESGTKFFVTKTYNENRMVGGINVDGDVRYYSSDLAKRTGRHFDIEKILEEMKNERN